MTLLQKLHSLAESELTCIREELPSELDEQLKVVSIHFESRPSEDDLVMGIEPDQLGLFEGNTSGEFEFPIPTRIVVWLQNHWEMVETDEVRFRAEIRMTLLHEIGHFFGWDEIQIAQRGLD